MPILPLDTMVPFFSTLGVMIYPAVCEQDEARSFAAMMLAEPVEALIEQGGKVSYQELFEIVTSRCFLHDDIQDRYWAGRVTGELLKILFGLFQTDPKYATWENAISLLTDGAQKMKISGSRTKFMKAKSQFASVAHLWAAWRLRDEQWMHDEDVGYDAQTDFLMFIAESEIIRVWASSWKPERNKAESPLSGEFWTPPPDWKPPLHQALWPKTGRIARYTLPAESIAGLKLPGAPKKGK